MACVIVIKMYLLLLRPADADTMPVLLLLLPPLVVDAAYRCVNN